MSELEEDNTVEKKPKPSLKVELTRVAIAIVILILFVPIFGNVVPRLLFGIQTEKNVDKIETKAIKQTEKILDKTADKSPEKPIEKTEEITKEQPVISEVASKNDELVHSLEEKIVQLEAAKEKAQQQADNKILSLVVFGQLKEAVKNGESYNEQLNKLKKLTEGNQDIVDIIAKIQPASEQGVAAQNALAKVFGETARDALHSSDSKWFYKFLHKFISVRKVGDQVGDNDESVLARAEVRLTKLDLRAALKELEQLSPPAKEVFAEWIAQANDLLDVQLNLDKLQLLLTKTESAKTESVFQP